MNIRFRNRLYLVILLSVMGLFSAESQTIHALSAEDAIALVKKNNISVKAAITNLAIQEQTNKEVTALALPNVKGSGATTDYFSIPVTLVPGEFFGGAPGSYLPVQFQQKFIASAGV